MLEVKESLQAKRPCGCRTTACGIAHPIGNSGTEFPFFAGASNVPRAGIEIASLTARIALIEKRRRVMRDFEEFQPYVNHLSAMHRRLHAILSRIRAQARFDGDGDSAAPAAIAADMKSVRTELVVHFCEEEQGGCLEDAVSRCPRLSSDVKRLEKEHPLLVAELDGLIAQFVDQPQTLAARLDIERRFDEFCENLEAHEAAENAVLRAAYGANIDEFESERKSLNAIS
jgi:hypothetical protein